MHVSDQSIFIGHNRIPHRGQNCNSFPIFCGKKTQHRFHAVLRFGLCSLAPSEQLVQGDLEQVGKKGEQCQVGKGVASLPFGHGLRADTQTVRHVALGHMLFQTEPPYIAAQRWLFQGRILLIHRIAAYRVLHDKNAHPAGRAFSLLLAFTR